MHYFLCLSSITVLRPLVFTVTVQSHRPIIMGTLSPHWFKSCDATCKFYLWTRLSHLHIGVTAALVRLSRYPQVGDVFLSNAAVLITRVWSSPSKVTVGDDCPSRSHPMMGAKKMQGRQPSVDPGPPKDEPNARVHCGGIHVHTQHPRVIGYRMGATSM
jgi:hypothetical protein